MKCPTCGKEKGTFEAPMVGDDEEDECARCFYPGEMTIIAATPEWLQRHAEFVGGAPAVPPPKGEPS